MTDAQAQIEQAAQLLPLSEATYLILLALHQPMHGYGVMQSVAAESGNAVRIGPGTIYGAITNLLRQGLIQRAGDSDSDVERRKLYTLTPLGHTTVRMEFDRIERMAHIGRRILTRERKKQ